MMLALSLGAMGCNNNDIGAPCILNTSVTDSAAREVGITTTVANTTSLDCPSRICLHYPPQTGALDPQENTDFCTAECSNDGDCNPGVPNSGCTHGFRCVTPFLVGGLCCKRLCVCADRLNLVGSDGGVPNEPPAQCASGHTTCAQ
jgi:hypothetical protein